MALAITTEQEQLADAVTKFAARHAPLDKTRAAFDSIAAGVTLRKPAGTHWARIAPSSRTIGRPSWLG